VVNYVAKSGPRAQHTPPALQDHPKKFEGCVGTEADMAVHPPIRLGKRLDRRGPVGAKPPGQCTLLVSPETGYSSIGSERDVRYYPLRSRY